LGVTMGRPSFAVSDEAFAYVCLLGFVMVALFVFNLRRSTTGLALNAVRWSPPGARTLGISVAQMKIVTAGLAALVAGIGGGFLVAAQTSAQPADFETFLGVIWLAALVTIGVRSNAAALIAGIAFTMLPALATAYLPSWTGNIPPVLFGLGAIGVAKFPEGCLEQAGQFLRRQLRSLGGHAPSPLAGAPVPATPLGASTRAVEEVPS